MHEQVKTASPIESTVLRSLEKALQAYINHAYSPRQQVKEITIPVEEVKSLQVLDLEPGTLFIFKSNLQLVYQRTDEDKYPCVCLEDGTLCHTNNCTIGVSRIVQAVQVGPK